MELSKQWRTDTWSASYRDWKTKKLHYFWVSKHNAVFQNFTPVIFGFEH